MKQNVSVVRLSNKVIVLDLVPFSEKVENHYSKPCLGTNFS